MNNFSLKDQHILVTGGAGFLGKFVVEKLKERGVPPHQIFVPRSKSYDLTKMSNVTRVYQEFHPQIVIHLAAKVGGIGANLAYPATFFYENLIMGVQLMEQARLHKVQKFVCLGTICSYPKHTPIPFKEENLWDGYPEETNAPYGIAKKALLVQLQAYRQQYGFNGIYLMPTNLYGPGDNFDPQGSHVIPALIRKCLEAVQKGRDEIVVWGTGTPTRDFLYVEDAAHAIVLATEKYEASQPVNLGSGREISIRKLAEIIVRLTGFKGKIIYDISQPDGQPRRWVDSSRAQKEFGFSAQTFLEEGLKRTIEWYLANLACDQKLSRSFSERRRGRDG